MHHILSAIESGFTADHVRFGLLTQKEEAFFPVINATNQASNARALVKFATGACKQAATALYFDTTFQSGNAAKLCAGSERIDIDRLLIKGAVIFQKGKFRFNVAASTGTRCLTGCVGIPVQRGLIGRGRDASALGRRLRGGLSGDLLTGPFIAVSFAAPLRLAGHCSTRSRNGHAWARTVGITLAVAVPLTVDSDTAPVPRGGGGRCNLCLSHDGLRS